MENQRGNWGERLKKFRRQFVPGFYLPRADRAFAPIDITLELTYVCNLKCPMCYQKVVQNRQSRRDHPSAQVYKEFLSRMSRYRPTIRMTGGEPMLYPHFFELAEYAGKLGLEVITPTNGTLLSDYAENIVSIPLNVLIVTITGPSEAVHDRQVGVDGAFRASVAGVKRVLKVRSETGSQFPRVFVNAVWSKENQECMPEMVGLAQKIGADSISFTHVWYWDQALVDRQKNCCSRFGPLIPTADAAFKGIDSDTLLKSIRKIRSMPSNIPVLFYPDLSEEQIGEYYSSTKKAVTRHVCRVPWLATYIRPNGDVAPCYLNYSTGNLQDDDFMQIWNGKKYRDLRYTLKRSGSLPACHRCTGSFLFSPAQRGDATLG